MVELIETSQLHRRQGLATELWQGMEKYYGVPVEGDPVTKEGRLFMKGLHANRS